MNNTTHTDYAYHVFLSYKRGGKVEKWVTNLLMEELKDELSEALGGEKAQLFRDKESIKLGDIWSKKIKEAIKLSCCIVPIWSPTYFRSKWCVAEWESFRVRAEDLRLTTKGLVAPIKWQAGEGYPSIAKDVQYADFTRFAYTATSIKQNLSFQRKLREFAGQVAEIVRGAPDFRPDWPIILPNSPRVKKLINEAPKPIIGRPSLGSQAAAP